MGRLTAIVLGAAAGGGFPQWNCRCPVCRLAWAGDARVRPRTQASLAVSADGEDWVLINASPDLRGAASARDGAASAHGHARQPDQGGGAHRRRDRPDRRPAQPARAPAVLALRHRRDARRARRQPDVRRAGARIGDAPRGRPPAKPLDAAGRACGRAVHGAGQGAALSRRREPRDRERDAIECRGRDCRRRSARIAYVPGAAAVTPAMRERLARADVVLFDGTLFIATTR